MNMEQIKADADALRTSLLGLMTRVDTLDGRSETTLLSEAFHHARTAVKKSEYEVVICGEAKRGKSSFVNALLGKDVVPMGVRETTSQLFRLNNQVDKAAGALVFEDGGRETISLEELARYGSQTEEDAQREPLLRGRALKWIEVNAATEWLPKGVHLVDTPGLGALYAKHAALTAEAITRADAVIYVLDSDQPLLKTDKQMLTEIYKVTPHVLFIQSKIDMKDESDWRALLERNKVLLQGLSKDQRMAAQIFPVSSHLMREAAAESDEVERQALLDDSGFPALLTALEVFIFRATGWTRCAWGAAETLRQVESELRGVNSQINVLRAESEAERDRLKKDKMALHVAFQKDWSVDGTQRATLRREMETVLNAVRQEAAYLTASGKPLRKKLMDEMDALKSRDALTAYAEQLPDHLKLCFNDEWRRVLLQAQEQIARLSNQFKMSLDSEALIEMDLSAPSVRDASIWDRIKTVNIDAMIGGGLAGIIGAGAVFATGLAFLGTPLVILGGLMGGWQGLKKITGLQLEQAKNDLRQKMAGLLDEYRNMLCSPDMSRGRNVSIVDEFVDTLRRQVEEQTDQEYNAMRERLKFEEQQLEHQAQLQGQQRISAKERMESIRDEWNQAATDARKVIAALKTMNQLLEQQGAE